MNESASSLRKRAQKVRLLAMDVDGVLTGGEIIVLESGEEVKIWNAKDRLALALLRDHKDTLITVWITGRSSKNVTWSAKDLGIQHVVQGSKDKRTDLEKILRECNLSFDQAAYIGDDLIDIPVMRAVGLSACPADAVADVKKITHFQSKKTGGQGAVRDVAEFILRSQKKWDSIIAPFLS